MKTNKFLIASLLILMGMGALVVSCDKVKNRVKRAQLIVNTASEKDGGDDEDPIIQGRVKKKNTFVPIDSAYVETVTYGTNLRIGAKYTDDKGIFTQPADTGTFYFKVTVPGFSTPYVTDTIYIDKDTEVTILVN